MSEELHPLDKLCTRCRLRIHDDASNKSYTHPVFLNSLEEVSIVILRRYVFNHRKKTVITVELSDDPAILSTLMYLRFEDGMFSNVELSELAQQVPARARADFEDAIRTIATTLRAVYDGVFGSDRVQKAQPVLSWEDLL